MSTTVVEFRIPEEQASEHLPPDVGRRLGDSVRVVTTISGSETYEMIGRVDRKVRRLGRVFFVSFAIRRRYRPAELASASLLRWQPTTYFEPTGEECGTKYDESTTCRHCRTGRTQVSELALDVARLPRRDVAVSLAGEVVVSERFREAVDARGFTGMAFRPVHDARRRRKHSTRSVHQLVFTGKRPNIAIPPTEFGADPFDSDTAGRYRCPLGHVVGLNILSEVTIQTSNGILDDATATGQAIGDPIGTGLIRPEPIFVVSRRLHDVIGPQHMTSGRFEVAHITSGA